MLCVGVLPAVCLSVLCLPGAPRGQKRVSASLEVELVHEGSGNQSRSSGRAASPNHGGIAPASQANILTCTSVCELEDSAVGQQHGFHAQSLLPDAGKEPGGHCGCSKFVPHQHSTGILYCP